MYIPTLFVPPPPQKKLSELILYDRTLALGPRNGCAPVCLQCLKPIVDDDDDGGGGDGGDGRDGVVVAPHDDEDDEDEEEERKEKKNGTNEDASPPFHFCPGCGWPLCGPACQKAARSRGRGHGRDQGRVGHGPEECEILSRRAYT